MYFSEGRRQGSVRRAADHFPQQRLQLVVGRVLEVAQLGDLAHVRGELGGAAREEQGRRRAPLRLQDLGPALLLRRRVDALPRQPPAEEVGEDVAERLQVVATALLLARVGPDARVPERAHEAHARRRRVVDASAVPVGLRESKVDDAHLRSLAAEAQGEVARLDVAVQEALAVHVPDAREHLRGQLRHPHRRELAVVALEDVLYGRP
mmetsp:Transcript_16463/g.36237  ORF Transcript_16463/g.36237 Transcript_16463/m.36237 type:complete len:208 (+) Transcript_16463:1-624(+)